jgi:tripartite-type tricarboxylate transporter receptor subunit TctC
MDRAIARWGFTIVLAALGVVAGIGAAATQDYPTRPIRIVVPTPPGGMSDLVSRVYAQRLTEKTKHVVIVENKTGSNGVLAADFVAKSPPDGYTIYLGYHGTQSVLQHLDPKLPYDPAKDFAPVVLLTTGPTFLAVHPASPWKSVRDVVDAARAKPKSLTYAHAGIGTTSHLVAEQFKVFAGIEIVPVPYRGQAPANQDLVAGHVSMTFDLIGNGMPNVRAGTVRPLAITASERSPLLPDVPTMQEAGFKGVEAGAWFAFFAPAGTPAAAVNWLNRHANEIFAEPAVRDRFIAQGMTLPLGPPAVLQAHVEADTRRWGEVIRRAGIKLQPQ